AGVGVMRVRSGDRIQGVTRGRHAFSLRCVRPSPYANQALPHNLALLQGFPDVNRFLQYTCDTTVVAQTGFSFWCYYFLHHAATWNQCHGVARIARATGALGRRVGMLVGGTTDVASVNFASFLAHSPYSVTVDWAYSSRTPPCPGAGLWRSRQPVLRIHEQGEGMA